MTGKKLDIKSDHIDEYLAFASPSLAASSIRLLKIDLNRFYRWYCAQSQTEDLVEAGLVAHKYVDAVCIGDTDAIIRRKVSSISKFISWITTTAKKTDSFELKHRDISSAGSSRFILSQKPNIVLLLIFLLVSLLLIVFSYILHTQPNNQKVDGLKRFVLYIPVISETLPESLNADTYKLKIFESNDANKPAVTVMCSGKQTILNSIKYVYIDSDVDCDGKKAILTEKLTNLNEYFIDIIVRTTKINSGRLHIESNQAKIVNNAVSQSHIQSDIFVSNQDADLTNDDKFTVSNTASSESMLAPRPSDTKYIPLNVFNIADVTDGDVVAMSSNNLTKALLSTPVIGIVEGERVIITGKTLVNVSSKSGSIVPGDYLSVSIEAGTVVKASLGYENVIGISLDDWPNDKNKVNIFLISK